LTPSGMGLPFTGLSKGRDKGEPQRIL